VGLVRLHVPSQHERRIVRRVIASEVRAGALERDRVQVGHEAHGVPPVRTCHESEQVQLLVHGRQHIVVDAQAAFLFDYAALLLEILSRQKEVLHPVGLEVEDEVERLRWKVVQINREVARGEAVGRSPCPFDQVVERAGAVLLAPVEHHVLEKVCDAGVANLFVPEPDR